MSTFRILLAIAAWPLEPDFYNTPREFRYFSTRYKKWITIPKGFRCDGATWAPNIGYSWLFHDWLFCYGLWDDGMPIKWREANRVMQDIMIEEALPRWVRNVYRKGIRSKWSLKAWRKHRSIPPIKASISA